MEQKAKTEGKVGFLSRLNPFSRQKNAGLCAF